MSTGRASCRCPGSPWPTLPVYDNIYTVRLMLYAFLAGAVIVALWAASGARRWLRIALPVLAAISLAPSLGHHHWDAKLAVPAFIADRDYKRCLAPGENVIAIPYGYMGNSILWQALAGFRFRLAGGSLGDQPEPFGGTAVVRLTNDDVRQGDGGTVLQLARQRARRDPRRPERPVSVELDPRRDREADRRGRSASLSGRAGRRQPVGVSAWVNRS